MDDQISVANLLKITSSLHLEDDDSSSTVPVNSSASVVASNGDILIMIFLCLPVKSLLVFKSVSKQWFSIITDSYFSSKHFLRNRCRPIPGLFLQRYLTSWQYIPTTDFLILDETNVNTPHVHSKPLSLLSDFGRRKDVHQSCNGLLLCHRANTFYICNPTTYAVRTLPSSPFVTYSVVCDCSLAFDPFTSPYYKVVCIRPTKQTYPGDKFHYQIEIYSSKTNSWRLSGDQFNASSREIFSGSGVFWNGSVHWVSRWDIEGVAFYFNVEQELMKAMPMPPVPDGSYQREVEYFGECRGHMHLIEMYDRSKITFDILEMETADYSGWTKIYHVNLEHLSNQFPGMVQIMNYFGNTTIRFEISVLLVEEIEQESSSKLVLQLPDFQFISYDLKDMSVKNIYKLKAGGSQGYNLLQYHQCNTFQFIESLCHILI